MNFKIAKSYVTALADRGVVLDFEAAVTAHHAELQHHYEHHEKIKTQGQMPRMPNWADVMGYPPDQRDAEFEKLNQAWAALRLTYLDPYPRPNAMPAVESAVRFDGERFIVDYEIVNDDPTPEQILARKKAALVNEIAKSEQAAMEQAQLPPGKVRLNAMEEAAYQAADAEVAKQFIERVGKDANPKDLKAEIDKQRSPEHRQFLRDQGARQLRIDQIHLNAAQAMSDVEDLTADNIDTFEIPAFQN